MIKLVLKYKGRRVDLDLPDGADIAISLDDEEVFSAGRVGRLEGVGPSARKVHRWLLKLEDSSGLVNLDPILVEDQLGLVPVSLGRALGSLEKINAIEVVHRKREDRNRIVAYKVQMIRGVGPVYSNDPENLFESVVQDVNEVCGNAAASLFRAICTVADLDGTIMRPALRDICFDMNPVPDRVPVDELNELERGDWINVTSIDPLVATVLDWTNIKKSMDLLNG